MARPLRKIAEDALEKAFETATCNKRGRGVPATEHSKFRNAMVADFRALFVSIFNTPFAWEGADWEKDKIPFFLTDSFWLNK